MPQKTSDTPPGQENVLKNYETLYRTLVETSPDAVVMVDLTNVIIMVNQRAVDMYGCTSKDELLGKSIFEIISPQYIETALRLAGKDSYRKLELVLRRKNGTAFWAELNVTAIKDAQHNPTALFGVIRDITERKEAEKTLQESEELYRTLIEASPYAITINDMQGRIFLVNQQSVEIHKCKSREDLLGKNAFDFIAPEDKEKLMGKMKKIIEAGGERLMEYSLRDMNGRCFPVEVCCAILKDKDGNPQAMMALGSDITERKKMEQALAEEKERLAVTLRSIADAVITVNTEGKIVLLNEVAEKLTGWKQRDAAGVKLNDVLNISDSENKKIDCNKMIKTILEQGEPAKGITEGVLIGKNEVERIITQSCAPIRNRDNTMIGVVLVIRDITEKQKMERELFKARKLESIGILAGGIAHDFNNILTGITSNLFMAKMNLPKDHASYATIQEAEKAAFRATKLTGQLITFAKGGAPVMESQSIKDIIEEAVGFSLSGSKAECELDLPKNLWTLEIDRGQIDQVITNLLINADQAMPKGGKIEVRAENATITDEIPDDTTAYLGLKPGKYVKITVKDEGVGIRPEEIDKIYDPYYSTKDSGTGLGLTICYSIIRKHNGIINVKSRVGAGTTFTVYLPASEKKSGGAQKAAPLKGSGKILVMDDEEVIRIAAGHVLKRIGYEVEFAKDGSEAIDKYQTAFLGNKPFDAIIMDLTIPGGMGGKEAINKLKSIHPDVVAIVSSGYSNDPIMARYKEYGFSGAISKPYLIEELNTVLIQSIGEKKKQK